MTYLAMGIKLFMLVEYFISESVAILGLSMERLTQILLLIIIVAQKQCICQDYGKRESQDTTASPNDNENSPQPAETILKDIKYFEDVGAKELCRNTEQNDCYNLEIRLNYIQRNAWKIYIYGNGLKARTAVVQTWNISISPQIKNLKYESEAQIKNKTSVLATDSLLSIKYFGATGSTVSSKIKFENDLSDILKTYDKKQTEPKCVWLNFNSSLWSDYGCTTSLQSGTVTCECNHTTTFALLLLVGKAQKVNINYSVSVVILVCEIISLVFLVFTVAFLLIARKGSGLDSNQNPSISTKGMKVNRTVTQVSICASLFCLHFIICFNFAIPTTRHFCISVTFLTHLFFLTTMFWSLNEGIAIITKLKIGFKNYQLLTIVQNVIGWGIPLLLSVVTISVALPNDNYLLLSNSSQSPTKYTQCVLSTYSAVGKFTTVLPAMLILATNIGLSLFIYYKVCTMYKSTKCSRPQDSPAKLYSLKLFAVTKAFLVLLVVLGLPWIILLLGNVSVLTPVAYGIHGVFNGLQGFFLFLLYCVFGNSGDYDKFRRRIYIFKKRIKAKRAPSSDAGTTDRYLYVRNGSKATALTSLPGTL